MKRSDCLKFFAQKGMKMQDDAGCGVLNGYPLSVRVESDKHELVEKILVKIHLASSIQKNKRKELSAALEKRASLSFTGTTLSISIPAQNILHTYELSAILNTVTSYLYDHHLMPPSSCPICGQEKPDVFAFYEGVYQPVHHSCLKKAVSGISRRTDSETGRVSYLTGVIGALIGMLIGMLPCAIILLIHNSLYAVLFTFVPICVYFGYKLLHGRFTNIAVVIMIVCSLIAFLGLIYIFLLVKSHNEAASGGLWYFKASFLTLFSLTGIRALSGELLQSFVFLLIGIICSWRLMTDNSLKPAPSAPDYIQSTVVRIKASDAQEDPQASYTRTPTGRYTPIETESSESNVYDEVYGKNDDQELF